jgi:glycosyltransferase involved in cell wall biosynthesis
MSYPLRGRTVLVISPQPWGAMRVSKHHYAVELASRGSRVFFLNPPDRTLPQIVRVRSAEGAPEVRVVDHRPLFPFVLRFHARPLFDLMMRAQIALVRRAIAQPIDLVWCFDPNLYSDLWRFGAPRSIYHVVDQISELHSLLPARSADLVLAVAPEILARLETAQPRASRVIEHGVTDAFVRLAQSRLVNEAHTVESAPAFGYIGNLLIPSLDRTTLGALVEAHPECRFHFWGALEGDGPPEARAFIAQLRAQPHVTLHGPRPPESLAGAMRAMDGFLVCYDNARDPNHGCNSHKVLEYFATGRVVVTSRLSRLEEHRALVQMARSDDNSDFAALFADTLARLPELNARALAELRLRLALSNSYAAHIDEIETAL